LAKEPLSGCGALDKLDNQSYNAILKNQNMLRKGGPTMAKQAEDSSSKATASCGDQCCKVEALVSVDIRGQMVLPKEIRQRANIRGGDKLAVTSLEKDGKVCCILLTKAEGLADMVKATLGPVAKEILGEQ
jgi:AbrB family looped-hinge helix DNA binding protein